MKYKKSPIKVQIPKAKINYFCTKAKKLNVELLGLLTGLVEISNGEISKVVIKDIVYPKKTQSNMSYVKWDDKDLPSDFIGTIHSHPNALAAHLSPEDVMSAAGLGEIVYGIYDWWIEGDTKVGELNFYASGPVVEIEKV